MRANISRIFRDKNAKFSGYCFYINTKIYGDFQICINIPLNISRPIYFKKISAQDFEDYICTNKLDKFLFWKNFFSRTWSFFRDGKTSDLGLIFPQKINFILSFQVPLFIYNIILKTWFKNLFRKTWKIIGFTLLNKPLEPCKLP